MTPTEYRQMLNDALNKPVGPTDSWALTITGPTCSLGARGELIAYGGSNGPIRGFTRTDVKRMLTKLDTLEAQAAAAAAIPTPAVAGSRISVGCEPCGLSVDTPNNAFGRAMIAAWPAAHAKDCKAPTKVESTRLNP